MKAHPIANVFPQMPEREFQELKADIQANGLHDPIVIYEDMILDGRHRYRACVELGLTLRTQGYTGSDPVGFVRSHNLHRRHLDTSQRSMCAARLLDYYKGEAKARHDTQAANNFGYTTVEKLPPSNKGKARDQAGKDFGVSGKSVDAAKKVIDHGTPDLQAAVDNREISVNKAKDIAVLPHDDQPKAIESAKKKPRKKPKPKPQQAPQENSASTLLGVLYGIERAQDAIGRLELSDTDLIHKFVSELKDADEFNKQRWRDCYSTLRTLEKIMRASETRATAA